MSSSAYDGEPSGSRAKGTKRKKSQKKRPCGKKARKDIIDRIDPSLYFFYHQNEDDTDDVKLHEINRKCHGRVWGFVWMKFKTICWLIRIMTSTMNDYNYKSGSAELECLLLCLYSPRFLSLCKFVHSMLLILVVVEVLRSSIVGRLSGFSR